MPTKTKITTIRFDEDLWFVAVEVARMQGTNATAWVNEDVQARVAKALEDPVTFMALGPDLQERAERVQLNMRAAAAARRVLGRGRAGSKP